MKAVLLIIILLAGCTLCESPYIKVGKDCCLDEDDNGLCDDAVLNKSITKIDIKELENDIKEPETVDIFKSVLDNVQLTAEYYQPESQKSFYVSSQKVSDIISVSFSFAPMCEEDHDIHILMNNKEIAIHKSTCAKNNTIDIDSSKIKAGENTLEFITIKGPFLVRNGLINIVFNDNTSNEQAIQKFVLESKKREKTVARVNSIVLQNYQDIKFSLDYGIYGDINITISPKGEKEIKILLNSNTIYQGLPIEDINLALPKEYLIEGENIIRTIALD